MNKVYKLFTILVFFQTVIFSKHQTDLNIAFEKIELDNGLDVIFHVDKSDPVVAVELMVHVGSAREVKDSNWLCTFI